MSTPFTDTSDTRPAFDRLLDDANFDAQGNFKKEDPIPGEGESGTSAPPAQATGDQPAPAEKPTAATQPSPDAKPPAPTSDHAKPEIKTGAAEGKEAPAAELGKPEAQATEKAAPAEDETEEALKARLSKPEDKSNEWQMRAYREGQSLRKKLQPIQTHLDRVGSTDRAARGLEFVAELAEPDTPIANAAEKLTKLSESRALELRDHYYYQTVDNYPDNVLRDVLGDEAATVAEVKEALQLKRSGVTTATEKQPQSTATKPSEMPKPDHFTDDEWEDFKVDFPDSYQKMLQSHAAAQQTPVATKETPATDPNADLASQVKELQEQLSQRQQNEYVSEVQTEGQKIEAEVFSVVEERLRELGLEPAAGDDEATTKLKEKTINAIRERVVTEFEGPNGPNGWDDFSLCSDEQKDNRNFELKVMKLLAKKDYNAARDYIEPMQARVDVVLTRVVEAEMQAHNAAMLKPTTNTRNAGQQGHQRPEIVGGNASGGGGEFAKTPWLDPKYVRPGESAFDAMKRYLDNAETLPGR